MMDLVSDVLEKRDLNDEKKPCSSCKCPPWHQEFERKGDEY